MTGLQIRRAVDADWPSISTIFRGVIERGDAYMFDESITDAQAHALWMGTGYQTYVAEEDGLVVGSYYIKANHPGHGSHVANGGYMTAAGYEGRGIARAMCAHSIDEALAGGFLAMQYNAVISTNERAVRLWQGFGFVIVGTLPLAFRHRERGLVDVFVMHRFL